MKNFTLWIVFLLQISKVWAQDFADIVRLETYASNDHSQPDLWMTYRQVALNLPIYRKSKTLVFTAPRFDHAAISRWGERASTEFVQMALPIGITQELSSKWGFTFVGIVRQNGFSPRAFQVAQLLTLNRRSHERLLMRYGFYFSREYFAPFFVPVVGLDWKVSPKWRVYGNLPINVTIENKLDDKRRCGVYFGALISSFEARDLSPGVHSYLQRGTNELYAYLETYFTPKILGQLRLGHSIGRRIRVYQTDETLDWQVSLIKPQDPRPSRSALFGDGIIAQINFIFRVAKE
jgi:hypothetical protein